MRQFTEKGVVKNENHRREGFIIDISENDKEFYRFTVSEATE